MKDMNAIKPGSTRDLIHRTLMENPGGLSGEQLLLKMKKLRKRKTNMAITRSLLDMVRTSQLVYRRLSTNPKTNRPYFYYHARTQHAAAAELEKIKAGPAVDVMHVMESGPEGEVIRMVIAHEPVKAVIEEYRKVLQK